MMLNFTNELWVVYVLVFGAALLGIQGIYWFLFKTRREQKAINRRVALSVQTSNPTEVLEVLRRERGVDFLPQISFFKNLELLIIQSGVRLSGPKLITTLAVIGLMSYVVLQYVTGFRTLAVIPAAMLAFVFVYLFLKLARRRRIAAFSEQLPDALDVIVRGLRAGHPFRVSLALVAREMPDPIGSEFGIVADEVTFGLEQTVAIDNLCRRVGHQDLSFFSTAVTIQQQSGGNLAEIMTRLSRLLRSRTKMRLKIRSLSAEGRLSAIALSATPFVLIGIISLIAPSYFTATNDSPIIMPAVVFGVFLLLVGNVVMYRMVNFKF
jgi:tight adherence protein B